MMNRRSFLQTLGLGIVGSTVIGKLIPAAPQKPSIPELELTLRSHPIVAKTRKLKAVWTTEIAQDLKAYHAIDAEHELASELSRRIQEEIDREVLKSIQAMSV